MATTEFVAGTVIASAWLNDVNDAVYGTATTTAPYNLLLALPEAQRAAIQAYTSTYDCAAELNAALAALGTAKKATAYLPDGLYNVSTPLVMPEKIRLVGSGRRGFGNGTSTYRGSVIKASGNTGVIVLSLGVLTATDIQLDHLYLMGNGGGTVDGVSFTNAAGVDITHCVVSGFSRYNIAFRDGYNLQCKDVYSSLAGVACFYIDGQYCQLSRCLSDGGIYSVLTSAAGAPEGLSINDGCHFEGASNTGLALQGNRIRVTDTLVAMTAGGIGILCTGNSLGLSNTQLRGAASATIGLNISGVGYRVNNVLSSGFISGGKIETGFGQITGSIFEGLTTGLELIGAFGRGIVSGCTIAGPTNSLLHTSGTRLWILGENSYDDDLGAFKAPTITAGDPLFTSGYTNATPTTASAAALTIPAGANNVLISGTTNITSMAVTGFSGRTVTLIFQGILTFTDGNNLKLAGNFVTTGDDTITLSCDGTNFYEICRSVN